MISDFGSFLKRQRLCTLKHKVRFELYHHDDDDDEHHHHHHHRRRRRRPHCETVFCPLRRTNISISRATEGDITLGEGKEWLWGGVRMKDEEMCARITEKYMKRGYKQ